MINQKKNRLRHVLRIGTPSFIQRQKLALCVGVLLLAAAPARGEVFVVTPGGTYDSIQAGIDACDSDDDIVRVVDGRWYGSDNVELDYKGLDITVQSVSGKPDQCYIDCELGARGVNFNDNEGPDALFEGIGIINGIGDVGGAIRIGTDCSPTIRNVRLFNNGAVYGGAIAVYPNSTSLIEDSVITTNWASSDTGGGGVYIATASPTFRNTNVLNNTAPYGAGVRAYGSILTFEDCVISNNDATVNGGGINLNSTSATFSDCTIQLNTAVGNGGGISMNVGSWIGVTGGIIQLNECVQDGGAVRIVGCGATFTNVEFKNQTAGKRGGAVYGENHAVMTFDGCTFLSCSSGWGGGAVFSSDSIANFTGCDFEENSSGTRGGALRCRDDSSGEITDGTFTGNEAGSDGGAISATHDSTIVVSGPSFTSNRSSGDGGAINVDGSSAEITGCRFELNEAEESGGAIASTGGSEFNVLESEFLTNKAVSLWGGGIITKDAASEVLIDGCTFDGNLTPSTVAGSGAGVASFDGPIRITQTDFLNNIAGAVGGALLVNTGETNIEECTVSGNESVTAGGGFYYVGLPSLTISDSQFDGNEATDPYARGGAIAIDQGTLNLVRCTFESNEALLGPCIDTWGGSAFADTCDFRDNNSPPGGGQGGGVRHIGDVGDHVKYKWCRFIGNWVQHAEGGAMYLESLDYAYIHNCGFFGNATKYAGSGGAIYARLIPDLNLANCAFSCNSARWHGGAIYVDTVDNAVVANCTFSRNVGTDSTSQGGGIHIATSNVDIDNSILWENEDASGITYTAQIYLDSGSCTVDASCFTDPACPYPLGTNICDDPLFVDPDGPSDDCGTEYDDLTLSDGSPCINQGDDGAVPLDLTDVDGDTNYYGEQIPLDLKDEDRFVDTVDMGAYEHQSPGGCPADFDGDGDVDTADLLFLLGAWGTPEGDVDGDGDTDTADLLALLAAWGACP